MASFFKSWGLDGSLKVTDFSTLHSNGVAGFPSSVHGVGEDGNMRCNRVNIDGYQALEMLVTPLDASTSNGHRTELVPSISAGSSTTDYVGISDWGGGYTNQERWYRIAFMIPEFDTSWLNSSGTFMVVAQLHQSPDATPSDTVSNPPLHFEVKPNSLDIVSIACTDEVTNSNNRIIRKLLSLPLEFNKWYDFVINVKWSWTTLGKIKIWQDRKVIYHDIYAPNCANNAVARGSAGNYMKFGIYTAYPVSLFTNQTLRVFHRGVVVGNETATFSDMYPELPNAVAINPDISASVLMPYIG